MEFVLKSCGTLMYVCFESLSTKCKNLMSSNLSNALFLVKIEVSKHVSQLYPSLHQKRRSKKLSNTEFTIFVGPLIAVKGVFVPFCEESTLNHDHVFGVGCNRCLFAQITFTFFTNYTFKLWIIFTSFTLSSSFVSILLSHIILLIISSKTTPFLKSQPP